MFRLAERKHQTVRQLLSNLDAQELSFWIAFYQAENYTSIIPGFESWLQTGVTSSLLANIFGKKGVNFKPEQFMPKTTRKAQTYEEMEHTLTVFFERRLKKEKDMPK